MFEIIIATVISVSKLLLLVGFAFIANTLLGASIAGTTGTFDKKILLNGIKKGVQIILGIFLLTIVFVAAFPVAEELGIDILSPEVTEVLSMASLTVPIFGGLIYYVTQSTKKILQLFGRQETKNPTE